jgi:hypothetical protein
MKPVVLAPVAAAVVAAIAASAAFAQTLKDGEVSVTPGKWNWKQETSVVGVPIKEENLECLIPQKATMKLSELATDLDEGCTVDGVTPTADGYTFVLICTGDIPGKANAALKHSDKMMQITAKGSAKVLGIPAGFSMQADATYVGDCSADEIKKAEENFAEEQAEKAKKAGQ